MTYILKLDGDNNWLEKQEKLRINGKKKNGFQLKPLIPLTILLLDIFQ